VLHLLEHLLQLLKEVQHLLQRLLHLLQRLQRLLQRLRPLIEERRLKFLTFPQLFGRKLLTCYEKRLYCAGQTGCAAGLHFNSYSQEGIFMARRRRKSSVLEKATTRASNLRAISPTLDLGPGLTLAEYEQKIASVRAKQETYNTALATLDDLLNNLLAEEKSLDDLNTRMLAGVGARWGKNSTQYEQAGGTRTDERKKNKDDDDKDKDPTKKPAGS
jgi:vacuolar-type H+-ATPase subunit I/STV1